MRSLDALVAAVEAAYRGPGPSLIVAKVNKATGKIEDVTDKTPTRAKGGKVEKKRAEKLSKVERSIIARDAAIRRWSKRD